MPNPEEATLIELATEYKLASEALHTMHSTTDVHGHGGIAGQAFTNHCAWQCNVLQAKFNPETGEVTGSMESIHKEQQTRYYAAKFALEEYLANAERTLTA